MALWQKEYQDQIPFYVNLLNFNECDEAFLKVFWREFSNHYESVGKNDERAKQLRKTGNEKFAMNDWYEAMEMYTRSMKFATTGSENLGMAYANRATCFLKMEKFDECLTDIELARKSNYPTKCLPKLNEREAICKEQMELRGVEIESEENQKPMLSFEADEKCSCLANVLDIQYKGKLVKRVIAKDDIKVGQVVVIEDAFHFNEALYGEQCCKTCCDIQKNFIPCPNCTYVVFCNETCLESNKIHKIACGGAYTREPRSIKYVESIVFAMNAFQNVDNLMSFVESAIFTRKHVEPICDTDDQLKYLGFLRLRSRPAKLESEAKRAVRNIFLYTLQIPEVKRQFDSKQKRRFLEHLIWQHMGIHLRNYNRTYLEMDGNSDDKCEIESLHIFSSCFNHSCYPNILFSRHRNRLIGFVGRNIKKGEEILTNRVPDDLSTKDRQGLIQEVYLMKCKCSKCVPCIKQSDRNRMQLDPDYQYFSNYDPWTLEKSVRATIIKKCIQFLQKYGRLPWSDEIQQAISMFGQCTNFDYEEL